jgi:transposase-like protein
LSYKRAVKGLEKAVCLAEVSQEAKERQKAVLFYQKYGLKLTQEAFEVKRTTLYNWQKKYKDYGIVGLLNGDRTPKRKRCSQIRQEIKDFIKSYRGEHGNIDQDEIKAHLDEHCKNLGIETTSTASIGRIIRALKDKGELNDTVKLKLCGRSGNLHEVKIKHKEKERIGRYKPQKPGDLLQVDSIHLQIEGKKRYLINGVDVKGKIAFSREYEKLNSKNATDFIEALSKEYPFEIKRIQTDNGSEFDGYAHQYLQKHNLTHFWNYPRSPKSNAFAERFNRTIKEQFVYRNEDCINDCKTANQKLKDWLLWYNTKRLHKALNYQTPLHYSLACLSANKSNML